MYTLIPTNLVTGRDKIKAIKGIRVLANLGLREAKELVESVYEGNCDNANYILSKEEVTKQERDYDQAKENLIAGGVQLVNSRKAAAAHIFNQLKELAHYATEHDCFHLSKEILTILNQEDRRQSNEK